MNLKIFNKGTLGRRMVLNDNFDNAGGLPRGGYSMASTGVFPTIRPRVSNA